jgi:hypothetical protein
MWGPTAVFVLTLGAVPLNRKNLVMVLAAGAQERLGMVRDWLIGHNRLIMAIVLGVLGVVIVGQGWAAVAG